MKKFNQLALENFKLSKNEMRSVLGGQLPVQSCEVKCCWGDDDNPFQVQVGTQVTTECEETLARAICSNFYSARPCGCQCIYLAE